MSESLNPDVREWGAIRFSEGKDMDFSQVASCMAQEK